MCHLHYLFMILIWFNLTWPLNNLFSSEYIKANTSKILTMFFIYHCNKNKKIYYVIYN